MMQALDSAALECLAALVDEGSFGRAAQRLSITQSAVSQRLRALEALVGAVLIVRSRPLRPTEAAQLLLRHGRQLRLLHADLERDLKELAPGGREGHDEEDEVSIAINADSIATWALPALAPVVRRGVPLEIITDDQDFTHEWLRQGQVLGCVTALGRPLRGCRIQRLGAMSYVAVASPALVAERLGGNVNSLDILRLPFIAFNRKDDLQREFMARALGLRHVGLRQMYVPSSEAQVRSVMAGWGVSVVPQLLVESRLLSGDLVRLLPDCSENVALYWHCWNLASGMLDLLTQSLVSRAAQVLRTDP